VVVLWVWVGVAVLSVVVLGGLVYGVLGALKRLSGEMAALDRDLRPVLTEVQKTLARVAEAGGHGAQPRHRP
jgi:hypothetical protein